MSDQRTAGIEELEGSLTDFNPAVRAKALRALAASQGLLSPSGRGEGDEGVANMHCHTFYSFNAYGYSPSSLAWLARKRDFAAIGIVDFDVLDGVDEFLDACELLGVRGSAGIETRVFVPEYAGSEINSPGEPGVAYHMGIGFTTGRVPASVSGILSDLHRRVARRNRAIAARANAFLAPVAVDYERDVLPLTPAGNPTERHLVAAYLRAAERAVSHPVAFWADRLGVGPGQVAPLMPDSSALQNLIRARLMKQGGPGYVPPESGMFPTMETFHALIVACGALPCAAWLDGTSPAEHDPRRWLEFMVGQGVVAVNVIPDRNWNLADPEARRLKVQNLYRVVEAARHLDLPLNVGTEMNSFGQKLVDDFDAPEIAPVRGAFMDGAYFACGHTALQHALGLGYQSAWAQAFLPSRRQRNEFYTQVGRCLRPGRAGRERLSRMDPNSPPAEVLHQLIG
jgi:hypothetical protein